MGLTRGKFADGGVYCPICKKELDAFQVHEDAVYPEPGNLSLCIYCAAVLIFVRGTRGLTLRKATEEERQRIFGEIDQKEMDRINDHFNALRANFRRRGKL